MTEKLKKIGIDTPLYRVLVQVLLELLGYGLLLIPSFLSLYLLDSYVEQEKDVPVQWLAYVAMAALFIHAYRFYFVNYKNQVYGNALATGYRSALGRKVLSCDIPEYENFSKSRVKNIINDATCIYTLSDCLVLIPADAIKAVITILLLANAHRGIAAVSILLVPLYMASSFANKKKLGQLTLEERSAQERWFQEMDTLVGCKCSINLNHAAQYMAHRHDTALDDYNTFRNKKHFYLLLSQELPRLITTLAPLLILIVGTKLVVGGSISLGQLVFCLQIISYLFDPLSEISILHAQLMGQKNIFQLIESFLSLPDPAPRQAKSAGSPGVWIENAKICRPDGSALFVIDSFRSPENGLVLIQGANGAGKSSLFNVLSGVFPEKCAVLSSDGVVQVPGALREEQGYLFYPNFIFPGTIKENILCGRTVAPERYETIHQVLGLPAPERTVCIKPDTLSLGEKQKIYLARLLVGSYKWLLLDEPGSNLDESSERALVLYLKKIKSDALIFVISHNALYNEISDKIYCVQNGHLAQI